MVDTEHHPIDLLAMTATFPATGPETISRRIGQGWPLVGPTSDIYHLAAGPKAARAITETE